MKLYTLTSTTADLFPTATNGANKLRIALLIFTFFIFAVTFSFSQSGNQPQSIKIPYLKLCLCNGECTDETVMRFASVCTDAFDNNFDMYKQKNDGRCPMISSKVNDVNYSINSLPEISSDVTLSLIIEGKAGDYSINAKEITSFSSVDHIYLKDSQTNMVQDLKQNPMYTFSRVEAGTSERFTLVFSSNTITSISNTFSNKENLISISNGQLLIDNNMMEASAQMHVELYNISGQKVFGDDVVNTSGEKIQVALPELKSGIYIIKASSKNEVIQKKVYLNL